jgi:hypothetical protein
MIRSCALAAIAGIALFSSISFVHAEPLPTETFKILPAALAVEAAQAAIASCKAQGYTISVAIVDRATARKHPDRYRRSDSMIEDLGAQKL